MACRNPGGVALEADWFARGCLAYNVKSEGEESAALGEICVVLLEMYWEYTTFSSKCRLRHMF